MWRDTRTKATFHWGWLTGSEVQSVIFRAGSMAASRQTQHRRRSYELRILLWRYSECLTGGYAEGLKAHRPQWHTLQQGHNYLNKDKTLKSPTPIVKHIQTTTTIYNLPHLNFFPTVSFFYFTKSVLHNFIEISFHDTSLGHYLLWVF